jgi:predicted Zn-dependent protease
VASTEEWPAYLYDGLTADRQQVSLQLDPDGIRVRKADGSVTLWPAGAFQQTQGSFSTEQLRIEIGTDPIQALTVSAPGIIRAMQAAYPRAKVRGQAQTTRFALWSLAALAVAAVVYAVGAPVAANWAAERVPPSWEVALGRGISTDFAAPAKQCADSEVRAATGAVLKTLTSALQRSPYEFSVVIVRDTMVNAFAAPGGFVIVFSGLIAAAETPEQFAGVMAHEIQHITHRHTTRSILREAPLRIALASLFGGTSAETATSLIGSIGVLRYRRADESEADREGLRLLQNAGVDPHGMVEFMRLLERRGGLGASIPTYLSSHPATAERVASLDSLARAGSVPTSVVFDRKAWQRVRGRCQT